MHSPTPFCSYACPVHVYIRFAFFTSDQLHGGILGTDPRDFPPFVNRVAVQIVSNVHRTVIADVTHASYGIAIAAQVSRLNKSEKILEISKDNRNKKLSGKRKHIL